MKHKTDGIVLEAGSVSLGGNAILSEVTLHLTERRVGIIGRNGSGKTTLLRLMAGLIAASDGTVRVAGLDPFNERKAMLGRIGILFQNPDHQILFPTVSEELAFGLLQMGRMQAAAEAEVGALLAAEGRSHWAKAPTHTLSQGQRHFLCLLAVLLMEPATLLLDEPFAGLDLPTVARLTRRIAGLGQQVITISHDPVSVATCDRVVWLEGGRVQDDGPAGPVLARFREAMARLGEQDADADLPG